MRPAFRYGFISNISSSAQRALITGIAGTALGMMLSGPAFSQMTLSQSPLFLTQGQAPLVLLTMSRDHKLFYEAYNDYSDLNGDGTLDVGYKPSIEYYGYFDSYKCYTYDDASGRFSPSSVTLSTTDADGVTTQTKKCSGKWSGDFLNYVTMSRMDALRKVLFGGYRSTDTASLTILERSFVPQDAHSWGKEYQSIDRDGYDIREYTPLELPETGKYHLFANTTLISENDPPLMRVMENSVYRVWEWLSIERPVADLACAIGNNVRWPCLGASWKTPWTKVPANAFSNLWQTTYNTKKYHQDSPWNALEFQKLVEDYGTNSKKCDSRNVSQINGSGNPFPNRGDCSNNNDHYLTIFKGTISVPTTGTYLFAVDGDDAVELFINGTLVTGWYGGHGACSTCLDQHFGFITLTAGSHNITFRHQDATGGDSYALYWKLPESTTATNYNVRVEVCNKDVGLESNCQNYGSSNKPVGLLQRQGENGGMYFGLLSGSYANNTQGGVLRKAISAINNEITDDGRFGSTTETCSSGSNCANGIISTINKLKITGFNYQSKQYKCGWIALEQMTNGKCDAWGNPIGEMLYEGLRYFSGEDDPTATFMYSGITTDSELDLPLVTGWANPYSNTSNMDASPPLFAACAKPYAMLISDVYPSFDSDSVPGSAFSSFTGDITGMDVDDLGDTIWDKEMGDGSKNIFIGQVGTDQGDNATTNKDGAPTAKTASSFGDIRGLAPGEPTREGSYSVAAAAYYGHKSDLNAATGSQKLNTYSVALAAPLPKLEIPVDGKKITILPFAKSVGGSIDGKNLSASADKFQPTNQIVDFYVDTIRNVTGSPSDDAINDGRPYYKFRINYEDVEQGADHDMDAIALYEIKLNVDNTVSVLVSSDYAAGSIVQHIGFAISGTTQDGAYLVVRDSDTSTGADDDIDYVLDCHNAGTDPANCDNQIGKQNKTALPLVKELKFTTSNTGSATLLENPLWYAAKWGGFVDDNGNELPDTTEWDADGDGVPDNYFLVTNPLNLENQLTKAFAKIKNDSATAAATSTNSFSYQTDSTLYQARFSSDGWSGELNAYPIEMDGTLGSANWQAHYELADATSASRQILTYDPDGASKGIPFAWGSMTATGTPYLRTSLDKNYSGTHDGLGIDRISFLRGDWVTGMRTRPYIKGTYITNKLGDIVSSQPQYVAVPNFGYGESTYAGFRGDNEDRTPMVYVGANDGMLHGFSADDGTEKIAYIPSEMYRTRNGQPRLSKLTASNYGQSSNAHAYYVDGSPSVGDVCTASCGAKTDWKTMLVGGLNAGGQGIYALNVTDPDNFSETNAASLVMWEFNDRQDTDNDADMQYGLGYTFSRPSIVRVCTDRVNSSATTPKACAAGRWVVIFGNGYNNSEDDGYKSTSGHAILYVLDAMTGNVIKKINTKQGTASAPNGLATPAAVDVDNGEYVDYVYAGDLLGNLWKFDLTSDSANGAGWEVAFGTDQKPAPLYTAKSDSTPQKITTAPDAMLHPNGGVQVVFGTGSYITTTDSNNTAINTVYGIRDNGSVISSTNLTNLQQQTVNTESATVDADEYRTISTHDVASDKDGWYVHLPDNGERVAYDPRIIGSVLGFTTTVPTADICDYGGWSWDYYVDAITGQRLNYSVFADVSSLVYGSGDNQESGFASARKSNVGITPAGTLITQGKGRGKNILCGSTGECEDYDVNLGQNLAGRVSWREIIRD